MDPGGEEHDFGPLKVRIRDRVTPGGRGYIEVHLDGSFEGHSKGPNAKVWSFFEGPLSERCDYQHFIFRKVLYFADIGPPLFVRLADRLRERGGELALSGASRPSRKVIDVLGIGGHLNVCGTDEEAVGKLDG
ncbi:MAG: STAS domain-containing protein [Planctomycetota bacterium]|jgi:hypothetical protein